MKKSFKNIKNTKKQYQDSRVCLKTDVLKLCNTSREKMGFANFMFLLCFVKLCLYCRQVCLLLNMNSMLLYDQASYIYHISACTLTTQIDLLLSKIIGCIFSISWRCHTTLNDQASNLGSKTVSKYSWTREEPKCHHPLCLFAVAGGCARPSVRLRQALPQPLIIGGAVAYAVTYACWLCLNEAPQM